MSNDSSMLGGAIAIICVLCVLVFIVLSVIAEWKLFEKMGLAGWISIIPVYNTYKMCEMTFGNGIWFFMFICWSNTIYWSNNSSFI